MYPKISIITPSFNQGQFIEKTILSILNQNYPNLEFIIIDGGSTDNTIDVIKKFEKHLKYWVSELDQGQSDAINKGLKFATGEIINWLNSDDYLEDGVLFKIANDFISNNIDILCGYSILITQNGIIEKRTSKMGGNFAQFISQGHVMQPSTYFKMNIFKEFAPLETSLHYMMDHYIWLQYICKYGTSKVKYVDYKISNVLVHPDAKSFKMISLFKEDKEIIYSSLFKSISLKWIYPRNTKIKQLPFNTASEQIKIHYSLINFLLVIEVLFNRDPMGNRGRINVKILFLLLFYFPKFSMLYIFNKLKIK